MSKVNDVYQKSNSKKKQKGREMKKKKPINGSARDQPPNEKKQQPQNEDQARLLGLSRPPTRFCKTRRWPGLLQLPPHKLGCIRASSPDCSDSSAKKSNSRPPVHGGCDRRPISPVIGSVIDVCVVTLLPVPVVVIDVDVMCWTRGCGGCIIASPIPPCGWDWDWDWGSTDEWERRCPCRPVAESGGETSPGLRLAMRRSMEETELE